MYLTPKKKKNRGKFYKKKQENEYCLKVGKLSTKLSSQSVNRYIEEATRYFKA